MSKEEDIMIDAQSLFEQFAPRLLFDCPREAVLFNDQREWWTIAEQIVPANRHAFWSTIKHWTKEPQIVIPPLEKAEIEEQKEIATSEGEQQRTEIRRVLYPKYKAKDPILTEYIKYYETEDKENGYQGRVEYSPSTPVDCTSYALPFYYPKVRAYRFIYQANDVKGSEDNHGHDSGSVDALEETGSLRLEIMPLDPLQPALLNSKMQHAMKTLLHKLFKWCIQNRIGYKKRFNHDLIVPKETYTQMYQRLKTIYADTLVSGWTEKTDPKKFVYEDIGIASFLLCLWAEEEKTTGRKPKFIDLGCGNGLLTYLLISEGYEGYGVDLADRKIWSLLTRNKSDILRMATLIPSHVTYPDADWIIGNHADELVPWIPLIAAKSGESCKFMIIPCCFFGLDGKRTLPLSSSSTEQGCGRYRAYTNYVKEIAQQCGFLCEEEYLRIPSTKNIALIGRQRRRPFDPVKCRTIAKAGELFVPRKSDREKEVLRQQAMKKPKTG